MNEFLTATLREIPVPAALDVRCEAGIARAASERQRRRGIIMRTASAAACAVIAGAAVAGGVSGYFRDIKTPLGTVTGTEYVNAAGEVDMYVSTAAPEMIEISLDFRMPDAAPYCYIEGIAPGSVLLRDGADSEYAVEISAEGYTLICVPDSSLAPGIYTVTVSGFYGTSKADAPIEIHGPWELTFSIN